MIECDFCGQWYHIRCVNLAVKQAKNVEKNCVQELLIIIIVVCVMYENKASDVHVKTPKARMSC